MLYTEKKIDVCHERFGGTGDVTIEHYIDEKMLNSSIIMYAKVTMAPGCGLGYHAHNGNTETVVVLSGTAQCNDDGVLRVLKPGDVTHCLEGHSHAISNAPDATEDLVLQALIAKVDA